MTACPVCGHHPSPRTATRQAHAAAAARAWATETRAIAAVILAGLPADPQWQEHREGLR